jgi:aryl-alcohol dehydrogenase-like predicted oxidoreductase
MQTTVKIGNITIKRIGLGTNRLTDTKANHSLLIRAVELGLNFIDTANIYTGGDSEKTIGSTLSPFPDGLFVATKGGMVRSAPANNEPDYLRACIEESLKSLKTKCITLYQLHRANPETPIEDTMRFFNDMKAEGKIKYLGLSEVTVGQIERARKVTEIVSVQNHYNLSIRKHEEVLNYCEANNIIFIPFFPLDSGRVTGTEISKIAKKYNLSIHQTALAWLLKRSHVVLPIPGTLSVKHMEENIEALNIELSDEDFESLNILK